MPVKKKVKRKKVKTVMWAVINKCRNKIIDAFDTKRRAIYSKRNDHMSSINYRVIKVKVKEV